MKNVHPDDTRLHPEPFRGETVAVYGQLHTLNRHETPRLRNNNSGIVNNNSEVQKGEIVYQQRSSDGVPLI